MAARLRGRLSRSHESRQAPMLRSSAIAFVFPHRDAPAIARATQELSVDATTHERFATNASTPVSRWQSCEKDDLGERSHDLRGRLLREVKQGHRRLIGATAFSCKQPGFDAVGAAAGWCYRTNPVTPGPSHRATGVARVADSGAHESACGKGALPMQAAGVCRLTPC